MTAFSRLLPAMASFALLAACTSQTGAAPEASPPPPKIEQLENSADASQASCGADKLADYIGVVMSDTVLAQIKAASGAKTIRVVGPKDMITMDFRQDRLTISTAEDGKIKTLRCV